MICQVLVLNNSNTSNKYKTAKTLHTFLFWVFRTAPWSWLLRAYGHGVIFPGDKGRKPIIMQLWLLSSPLGTKYLHHRIIQPALLLTVRLSMEWLRTEIVNDSLTLWTNYIVGYFIGDPPHIDKVHETMNQLWSVLGKPSKIDSQYINPKTVLFKINNAQIRSRVLRRYYWHISDVPLVCPGMESQIIDSHSWSYRSAIMGDLHNIPD